MAAIVIEFVVDDRYHREFHREWIAAMGPGWQSSRHLALAFAATAVGLGALGWALDRTQLAIAAAASLVVAILILATLTYRRSVWLDCVRTLPWFGKAMRIEVRDGDLVQIKDFAGDPRYHRMGAIVPTPNGYLVKYHGLGDSLGPAVSATEASVYIPHRAIMPPMTKEAFLGSLSAANLRGENE